MSRLRDRMAEDLRLRGRARSTIDTYVPCVRQLLEKACMPPSKIDAVIVRAFFALSDEPVDGAKSTRAAVGCPSTTEA